MSYSNQENKTNALCLPDKLVNLKGRTVIRFWYWEIIIIKNISEDFKLQTINKIKGSPPQYVSNITVFSLVCFNDVLIQNGISP